MAIPKIPNQRKANLAHKQRVEKYAQLIQRVYDTMAQEAAYLAGLSNPDGSIPFRFSDYPLTKNAIVGLQTQLASDVKAIIMAGTSDEWKESNLLQDLIANKVITAYTGTRRNGDEYEQYFQTNPDALKAFQERKDEGMNLSTRVWNLSEQYKTELEESITAAIVPGTPAVELAADVKRYLKEPDKRFRRIKEKMEDGTIKWQLSNPAKQYHPGRGVYRSSARNAQRLARTEINMAYRTAEQERWKQFDFVVGYEVKTTQNGKHVEDICDRLAGKYPKDFKFRGWHPQCYDELSEVLTRQGWKRFKDVVDSDEILSLNPESRELEWVSIVDIQRYDHTGDMIHFFNRSLDCLVTPEHRMVYLNKSNGEIRYCQGADYTQGKGAFYRGAEYFGEERESFEIEGRSFAFDDFCEFMGYYLSDGSLQHGTGVCISQQEGETAFDSILDVCRRMGYDPKVCHPNICVYNSALNRYLRQFGRCTDKFIPEEIKSASKRQIRIFLDAYLKCDGSIRQPKSFIGSHGNVFHSDNMENTYFTTSERIAGDLSELILKVGHRPSFSIQQPKTAHKKDGSIIKGNHVCYRISECYSTTATVFKKEVEQYSGKVYDLTLERNHIMYIRRNGKCFWGSNCMCYCIPILKTEDEFWALDEDKPSANEVTDVPSNFKEWVNENSERIERAEKKGTLPYFIRDNREDVEGILNPKTENANLNRYGVKAKFDSIEDVIEAWDPKRFEERERDEIEGVTVQGYVGELQGFNGLPNQLSKAEFEQLIQDDNYVIMYRGYRRDAETNVDNFLHGKLYEGKGGAGDGSYFSTNKNEVLSAYVSNRNEDHLITAAFDKRKVKIANADELREQWMSERNAIDKKALRAGLKAKGLSGEAYWDEWDALNDKLMIYDNFGAWATAKGYDVIYNPSDGFYVVLNRTKLCVLDPKLKSPHYGSAMKLGREATKEAMKVVENISAPQLSEIQKKNIRELADALGIPRKEVKPMSFLDADQGASNPTGNDCNCQSCVVAFSARRRGLDCYAKASDNRNPSKEAFQLGERFQDGWLNPKTGKPLQPTILRGRNDEEIIVKLKRTLSQPGEYVLGINDKDGAGHVINVIKHNGNIIIHDEQATRASERYRNLDSFMNIDYLEIIKIDKAILNIDLIKGVLNH